MVLRIGGMASGMDTESIIKDLMKAERMPLDKLKQKRQTLEWKRDQYREMNILLQSFKDLTSVSGMALSKNYRASSATSSNESFVTAVASTSASQASYNISNVTLAKAETWVTSVLNEDASANPIGTIDASKAFNDTAANTFDDNFWDASPANSAVKSGKVGSKTIVGNGTPSINIGVTNIQTGAAADMSVEVNGVKYNVVSTLNTSETSPPEVQINASGELTFHSSVAANATIKVNYIQDATAAGEKYTTFTIQTYNSTNPTPPPEKKFLVSSTETLNSVVSKVNASDAGVNLFYDSVTKKLSMTQKETGKFNAPGNNIIVDGIFATDILKLKSSGAVAGTDAKLTINGLETTRKTNTFEMNGVTFTLKKDSGTASETASVNVIKDTNAVYDNIKKFVDQYNTLIAAVHGKTSEERYRSYTPLTDEQREQLSDKQQEQWEEKAKSGLLRRDSMLSSVLTNMRNNLSQVVSNSGTNNSFNQLAEIGITTAKYSEEGGNIGKLVIDETKLKKVMAENPEAVEALFIGGGSSASVGEQGLIHRLNNTVGEAMDKIKGKAGSKLNTSLQQFTLGRQLTSIDSSITRFEDRLIQVEDRYWKQFTAMEKAMQQANSQSSYLMQQFSM